MASETCSPTSDRVFGPRVDPSCRALDFTLLFGDTILTCLPAAVFVLLLPAHIVALSKLPVSCSLRSKLFLTKLVNISIFWPNVFCSLTALKATLTGILALQVVHLILRLHETVTRTSASLAADVLAVAGTGGAAWLSYIDHQRSLRSSTLLSLYFAALIFVDISRVRTLWLIGSVNAEAAVMTATLVLTCLALFLESSNKRSSIAEKRVGAPEEYSGFWPRAVFAWLFTTFRAGYSKVLVQDDLPILDTRLQSHGLHKILLTTWAKCKQTEQYLAMT